MLREVETKLPWWQQLRTSLIALVLVMVVAPLGIEVGTVIPSTYSQGVAQVINQLDAVADVKSEQILNWLAEGQHGLSFLLSDDIRYQQATELLTTQDDTLQEEFSTFLTDYQGATDTFDNLIIYDTKGLVVGASNPVDIDKRINRQPYFEQSLAEAGYIQPPFYAVNTNRLAVFVTAQLVDENGEIIGILAGSLRIETLNHLMLTNSTGFTDTGETYLVSLQTNYFLTPSRFEGYPQNQAYRSEGINLGLDGQDGSLLYNDYRGEPVIGVHRWLPVLDAALIVEVNQDEALASTFTALRTIAIIAAISAVLAILIGYRFANFVSEPIIKLTQSAIAVTKGDYSQRVESNRSNEIGQLSTAFNTMTKELETNIQNLETLNAELETRVEDRTRDLNIAAQVSQQVTRVLDMQLLLPYLSNLTKEGFELSHVSVFVYDNTTGVLRLEAGSGEVGKMMLKAGKQFHIEDRGLVPLAARTAEAQRIDDVMASNDYFANPLLPNTRSEMAVPMRVGTELIGVMDLQSDEVNHFTEDQVNVLTALAEQIAIAIRNANLYQQAEAARSEAEQSNKVKSQFLAAMSHELRTPLNGIMNFTGVVADGMVGPVNEKQEKFLKDAVNNAEHLLSLINDVLDISKIESGALKLFIEEGIDITELSHDVVRTGELLIKDKPIQLITEIASDLPEIVGDKRRIRQILLNILSNACKFTQEGSITFAVRRQDDEILVRVTDTGPGIAKEDHEAVFETFMQTETGLRSGGGTGLGMPISRKLAEAHGGQLWIESELGQGASFYVTIPVQAEELKMQLVEMK